MYAEVIIEYPVKSLDKVFTYDIGNSFINIIKKGMKVKVPFGKQILNGIVINITNKKPNYETKSIISIENKDIYLTDEQIRLANFLKKETLCPLISAFQALLPSALKIKNQQHDYDNYDVYISLKNNNIDDFINKYPRRVKQIEILKQLKTRRLLKKDISLAILKPLDELGYIKYEYERKYRININNDLEKPFVLNEEQQKAYDTVASSYNKYMTYLLLGVTGSGKTEVYMHLVSDVINMGKTAIILVPEICLTTQTVQRFYNRFGKNVAIFHSGLSEGEKYDEYQKIYNNEVSIVVGTRSSIFVPLNNLGIIILDEEHSDTYHQENNPRYDTIEVAKYRASINNIPLILASATPSLEAKARADKGVYKLLLLSKRANNMLLPTISIVDMKKEMPKHNLIISDELKTAIDSTLSKNEQVILLLNRRGFSTFVSCSNCGYTYKCPNCDISLTYHKTTNNLRCHYCGYYVSKDETCPNCHEESLNYLGLGTQKVEEYLNTLFPNKKIIRMDQDTTSKKGSYQKIINAFASHEYDILLGTQMISKGLDFKNVTLVGVINADTSLNIPDFRANEKTFSLLYQTSGRSGRDIKEGKVIIQTYNPDNMVLNYVKNNDYNNFYLYEMDIRHKLKYPPYTYICLIVIKSKDYEMVSKEANIIKNMLSKNLKDEIILGPTPAGLFRINNIFHFQITIKYKNDELLKKTINDILVMYIENNKIDINVTFNPVHL